MLYKIFLEFYVESENSIIYRMFYLKNPKFGSPESFSRGEIISNHFETQHSKKSF